MANEAGPARVPRATETRRAGETGPGRWDWVERTVWTSRMLQALDREVKGEAFFQARGLFGLEAAHAARLQSARG